MRATYCAKEPMGEASKEPESNQRPQELQSRALPIELSSVRPTTPPTDPKRFFRHFERTLPGGKVPRSVHSSPKRFSLLRPKTHLCLFQ